MFKNAAEIAESLIEFGFSENDAHDLARTARRAFWLEPDLQNRRAPGLTFLGGQPFLPEGVGWPWRDPYPDLERRVPEPATRNQPPRDENQRSMWDHMTEMRAIERISCSSRRPLSFIAQFDLADLNANHMIDSDLPDSGRLLLFYDYEQQPWGYAPEDLLGLCLLWDDSPSAGLNMRQPPPELDQTQFEWSLVFSPTPLKRHFSMVPMLPFLDALDEIGTYQRNQDRYFDWYSSLQDNGQPTPIMGHRIGGWPSPVQGPMQHECQLVSHGLYLGGVAESPEEEQKERLLAQGALDWVFLFQIASNDDSGFMFGDDGIIYVWIRRDDLRLRRFDMARLILQCY